MQSRELIVYIVDDDPAVRDALCWLMKTVSLPTRAFDCADICIDSLQEEPAGCLITDVRMPGMSGLDLQRNLYHKYPDFPVIVITGHGDIDMAVRAMKAGAFDFIQKPFNDQELVDCVHKAIEKGAVADQRKQESNRTRRLIGCLTDREQQVLHLIVGGNMNKQIAATLCVSEKTVEVHRSRVMKKLEARSVAELVRAVLIAERFLE
ncbi:MAG: response regulator transcription factor [Gammaproteobacteria bacterium]|nr:response regulator transcription factor [Gammaproteobacteria bacterium]